MRWGLIGGLALASALAYGGLSYLRSSTNYGLQSELPAGEIKNLLAYFSRFSIEKQRAIISQISERADRETKLGELYTGIIKHAGLEVITLEEFEKIAHTSPLLADIRHDITSRILPAMDKNSSGFVYYRQIDKAIQLPSSPLAELDLILKSGLTYKGALAHESKHKLQHKSSTTDRVLAYARKINLEKRNPLLLTAEEEKEITGLFGTHIDDPFAAFLKLTQRKGEYAALKEVDAFLLTPKVFETVSGARYDFQSKFLNPELTDINSEILPQAVYLVTVLHGVFADDPIRDVRVSESVGHAGWSFAALAARLGPNQEKLRMKGEKLILERTRETLKVIQIARDELEAIR